MNYKDLLIIGKSHTIKTISNKSKLSKYKNNIFNNQIKEIKNSKSDIINRIISIKENVFEVDSKYHNFLNEILKIYYLGYDYSVIISIGAITEELSKQLLIINHININNNQLSNKQIKNLIERMTQERIIEFLSLTKMINSDIKGKLTAIRKIRNKYIHSFQSSDIANDSKKIIENFLDFMAENFKPKR